jgi:hypothetical protein
VIDIVPIRFLGFASFNFQSMETNQFNSSELQGSSDDIGCGAAFSGLGSKVRNIDGKLFMPRRGILKSSGHSVSSDDIAIKVGVKLDANGTLKDDLNQVPEINLSNKETEVLATKKTCTDSVKLHERVKEQLDPILTSPGMVQDAPEILTDMGFGQAGIDSVGRNSDQTSKLAAKEVNSESNASKLDETYASKLAGSSFPCSSSANKINFRQLESEVTLPGFDIVLPRQSVQKVNDKLSSTLFGYFIGTRVAYPVVEFFVKEQWKPFGLQKIMMNSNGFFFFKFSNDKGMFDALAGGPWLIKNKPIVLNIWSPLAEMVKQDLKTIPTWVKFHDVPLVAYTDDGLSLIASKIGMPVMLDSYTAEMCENTWGRSSFARALIEISADRIFTDSINIAVPDLDCEHFASAKVTVEYEWKPPHCSECKIFGHILSGCPKKVRVVPDASINSTDPKTVKDDEFTEVKRKKKGKKPGIVLNNQKPKFEYRPKSSVPPSLDIKSNSSRGKAPEVPMPPKVGKESKSASTSSTVPISNPFVALDDYDGHVSDGSNDFLDDAYDETAMFMAYGDGSKLKVDSKSKKGASPPLLKRGFL